MNQFTTHMSQIDRLSEIGFALGSGKSREEIEAEREAVVMNDVHDGGDEDESQFSNDKG